MLIARPRRKRKTKQKRSETLDLDDGGSDPTHISFKVVFCQRYRSSLFPKPRHSLRQYNKTLRQRTSEVKTVDDF